MGRNRREISEWGALTCTSCGQLKHITEFYTDGSAWVSITTIDDKTGEKVDTWFGKPMSKCKDCQRDYSRERSRAYYHRVKAKDQEKHDELEFLKIRSQYARRGIAMYKDETGKVTAFRSTDTAALKDWILPNDNSDAPDSS